MSGPIVRTGATPEFWQNWDQVFGKKKPAKAGPSTKKTAKKESKSDSPTASGKKPVAKKAAKKKSKKS